MLSEDGGHPLAGFQADAHRRNQMHRTDASAAPIYRSGGRSRRFRASCTLTLQAIVVSNCPTAPHERGRGLDWAEGK
jgi:hypothetical protein